MTVLCGVCNAENRDAAKFCKGCGRKIDQAWPQPVAAVVALGDAAVLRSAVAVAPAAEAPPPSWAAAPSPADATAAASFSMRPRIGNGRWIASLALLVVLLVVAAAWWGHRNRSIPIAEPAAVVDAGSPANSAAPVPPPAVVPPAAVAPPVVLSEKMEVGSDAPAETQAPAAKPRKAPAKKQAAPAPAPVQEVVAPAPPPAAPEPVRVASPQETCVGLNFIAKAQCLAAQCARPDVASHGQCEAVRRQQRLEEEKRNPVAN